MERGLFLQVEFLFWHMISFNKLQKDCRCNAVVGTQNLASCPLQQTIMYCNIPNLKPIHTVLLGAWMIFFGVMRVSGRKILRPYVAIPKTCITDAYGFFGCMDDFLV